MDVHGRWACKKDAFGNLVAGVFEVEYPGLHLKYTSHLLHDSNTNTYEVRTELRQGANVVAIWHERSGDQVGVNDALSVIYFMCMDGSTAQQVSEDVLRRFVIAQQLPVNGTQDLLPQFYATGHVIQLVYVGQPSTIDPIPMDESSCS